MAVGGNISLWADTFPDNLLPVVLDLIVQSWPAVLPVASDAKEEPTTRRLREVLRREKDLRQLPFTIWPESSETDPTSGKETGRIDLRFLHGYREDVYLSFECKRLYYLTASGRTEANVSEYTGKDGMLCYVSQQYSKGLPHGGMIGYILNGSLSRAKKRVEKSIDRNRVKLKLKAGTLLEKSRHAPSNPHLAESIHLIFGNKMTIYHVLLEN